MGARQLSLSVLTIEPDLQNYIVRVKVVDRRRARRPTSDGFATVCSGFHECLLLADPAPINAASQGPLSSTPSPFALA